jgi:SpoVK/Ycf46/Vps4 family AAA+-type ATPase
LTTPYEDGREHLRDELRRLDLLLQRYLAAWRSDRGGAGEGGGLYVSDAQVDRLLRANPLKGAVDRPQSGGVDGSVDAFQSNGSREERIVGHLSGSDGTDQLQDPNRASWTPGSDAATAQSDGEDRDEWLRTLTETVRQRERETRATDTELPLVALADRFGLRRRHVDALLVALAPELDLKYETVYAYLQDDLTRKRPTVGLVLRVVGGTVGSETDERVLLTPGSPLLDDRLLRLAGSNEAVLSRPVEVDRRIVASLLGEDELDRALEGIAEHVDPASAMPTVTSPDVDESASPLERLPVAQSARDRLSTLSTELNGGPPMIVHFSGPYGSGRTAAATALAEASARPLVAADADRIPPDDAAETLALLDREARLGEGVVHLRNVPPSDDSNRAVPIDLTTLFNYLDKFEGSVFLSGAEAVPPRLGAQLDDHAFATVTFERPSFDLRRSLWNQIDLPSDSAELASKFQFTAGQIEDTAATARALAIDEPTADDVFEACRAQSRERIGDLARQVEPIHGWEDIVLPEEQTRQLREVAAHVEHRGTVYSEWGFEERFNLGTGVNVLFAGPSGTGKTMAAEVIAGDAGLDLYKVDLASVVSKYIGETETNIGRVFDEAEASNAVLFFDEADALFGERSEVSDAHDRYANVEVDYLLERMEEHDGVVLLATNLAENMDDAFQRRINLTVEFPIPDRSARERIWRGMFPAATPVGDLDWEFLSEFELTGGSIKNAALTAAFLAADEDGTESVEMRHAVGALWRELQKGDRLVSRANFGEYREHLP